MLIRDYIKGGVSKKVKQVLSLYTSMISIMLIGILVSIINTRYLGAKSYGDFKFLLNVFNFFTTALTFGLFVQGGRAVALSENKSVQQGLFGILLIVSTVISVILTISVLMFSFIEEKIFENNLSNLIIVFSPFLFVFPLQLCIDNILQGNNRIYSLSFFRLLPQLLFLLISIMLYNIYGYSLEIALSVQVLSLSLAIGYAIIILKPKFYNPGKFFSILKREYHSYGFPVYLGFLAGVASSQIGLFSISYFLDNTNVGYFALAVTITTPLSMMPGVVGTAFFKEFTTISYIPVKVTLATLVLSLTALILFFLIAEKLIIFLYSDKFSSVVSLTYYIALGSVLYGFGDYVNRFVGAKGRGNDIRNSNLAVGGSNILFNILLVYIYGTIGAAYTKVISGLIYIGMMFVSYRRIVLISNSQK